MKKRAIVVAALYNNYLAAWYSVMKAHHWVVRYENSLSFRPFDDTMNSVVMFVVAVSV